MRKVNRLKVIIFSGVIIFLLYLIYSPYKLVPSLPSVTVSDVISINIDKFDDSDKPFKYEGDFNDIVNWYNKAKELKSNVGTTSDCRIDINLKENKKIIIWNLYSNKWVVVAYEEDDKYYQTNVSSKELAEFFIDIQNNGN